MGFTEQELSIQITDLNIVIISTMYFSLCTAANAHQSERFNKLTAESTSTDHESLYIPELRLNFATINLDLIVVSAIHWGSINWSFRKCFQNVIVKPLFKWRVLAREFYNFLSNYTTEKRTLWYQGGCRKTSCLGNDWVVKFFYWKFWFLFRLCIDSVGQLYDMFCFLRSWILVVLWVVSMNSS